MMRLLFLTEYADGGGAEKVLWNLVNQMDTNRFDITVRSIWPPKGELTVKPEIHYQPVFQKKNRVTEIIYRAEAAARLTYPLHLRNDYDVECAFLEFGPTKIIASSSNKHAKKLAWIHCDIAKIIRSRDSFREKYAEWYRQYDQIVCVSQTVKQSFDWLSDDAFPSIVLHNYVNSQEVLRKSEEPLPFKPSNDTLILAAVGTLYPPKNYPRLLRTFARLQAESGNLELWILGDGPDRESLEALSEQLGLSGAVRFCGFQKNPYPFMRQADLLVCSSNYEGFSTVITEGLILGKPIVTTECSGMRELLGDSEYGCITDNNDDAFYYGLRAVINDPQLRQSYAEKASLRGKSISGDAQLKRIEAFFLQLSAEESDGDDL